MVIRNIKEKILLNTKIEEVIGDFIVLKRVGMNYRGFSPFSEEKNPSFIVSPVKKIWKDFSSGKGGDVISFLMEHEKFSYIESLYYLAKKYNIDNNFLLKKKIQINENSFSKEIENLYIALNYAKKHFIEKLFSTKEGINNGLTYLKKRNFNIKIIKKFELGYASCSWKEFTKKSINDGLNIVFLIKTGLIFSKKSKYFDSFRKRIMFPFFDLNGKTIGFGGRKIDKSIQSKYINSPENFIFRKRKILYGLFQSKKYILRNNFCYLVEGYTDVISLYQSGIKNVVSSSGISLSIEQILLIKRFTNNIVLFYDNDLSGIKATLKIINIFLEQDMNLKILFIDKEEDPDSISKKYTPEKLKFLLKRNSHDFISFKEKIFKVFYYKNIDNPIEKSFLISSILKSFFYINNLIKKELYLQKASKILKIDKKILYCELERIKNKFFLSKKVYFSKKIFSLKNNNSNQIIFHSKNKIENILFIENKLVELIMKYGKNKINTINGNLTIIEIINNFFIKHKIKFFSKKNQDILAFNTKNTKKYSEIYKEKLEKLHSLSNWSKIGIEVPSEEKNLFKYVKEILLRFKSLYITKSIDNKIEKYRNNNIQKKEKKSIINDIIYLTNMKNKINRKLHRYV